MSLEKAKAVRQNWDSNGTKQLKISKRPPDDCIEGSLKPHKSLSENIKKRMSHLAEVLELLHRIYFDNTTLYGDRFLAFVGNEVVRKWPWIDFPFISENAKKLIEEHCYEQVTGRLPFEIKDKVAKKILKKLSYEHWTPISFFRDVFHSHPPLNKETFFYLLVNFYRVVWITKEEDDLLNKQHRSWRPSDTYEKLGIEIVPHDAWFMIRDEALNQVNAGP